MKTLPEDPIIRRLVQQARASQLSRRTMLAGAGAGATALALAACAPEGGAAPTAAPDRSDSDKTLTWANWPFYIDEDDDGNYPTLTAFEEQTGISVTYDVSIDDNNSYYGKIKDQLALGQDIGADVAVLTDWMVSRLIRFGYVQTIDTGSMPNFSNLNSSLLNPDWDPGRSYSLPWQGGFAGIVWNKDKVPGGLESVSDLWKPEFRGRVGVLSEMRDTMGLLMLENGVDISGDWGADEYNEALDVFRENISSGQIRNVKGNSYIADLENEDTLVAIAWSGDIAALNYESGENWEFVIPSGGATLWNDNFVVPIGSPRKKNAETLMNYYYEPAVAAEVAAWVNFITPVDGAKEAMAEIDEELAEDPFIFPDDTILAQSKMFRSLSGAEEAEFNSAFQAVLAS